MHSGPLGVQSDGVRAEGADHLSEREGTEAMCRNRGIHVPVLSSISPATPHTHTHLFTLAPTVQVTNVAKLLHCMDGHQDVAGERALLAGLPELLFQPWGGRLGAEGWSSERSRDQRKQPGRDLTARAHSLSEWLSGPSLHLQGTSIPHDGSGCLVGSSGIKFGRFAAPQLLNSIPQLSWALGSGPSPGVWLLLAASQ